MTRYGALCLLLLALSGSAVEPPPISGEAVPGLESYDRVIAGIMLAYDLPGAGVAVARRGTIVYARGFGLADRAGGRQVQPDTLFRIASVSKPITAVAVLKLVEEGRLGLDDPVVKHLDRLPPLDGATIDPRWEQITVRHLLHHAGGFDRGASFDPMFRPKDIAEAVGVPAPAGAEAIVRYMRGQPLEFDPGSKEAYSNFGYCLLGRVIERITGRTYEQFARESILAPMGITTMRVGATQPAGRAANEARYYLPRGAVFGPSIFPGDLTPVYAPDGGFYLEAMDAHGGWIASASDLVRFALHCDGRPDPADILAPETVARLYARPELPYVAADAESWYAMGWSVRRAGDNFNAWHTGALPGTSSLLVRGYNDCVWAVVYNGRNADAMDATDGRMWDALRAVTEWPGG